MPSDDPKPGASPRPRRDWTTDEHGRQNSSEEFEAVVTFVARILESHRLGESLEHTARLIVAQLAHTCRLGPHGVT